MKPEDYTLEELTAVNEYGIPEVVMVQDKDKNGQDIVGQYKVRIPRIGDKGYSLKCRTQFTGNAETTYNVHFSLKTIETFPRTVVKYDYTHFHNSTETCTLEYNSNTNLVLLNGEFIEDNDNITVSVENPPEVNELQIQMKPIPE